MYDRNCSGNLTTREFFKSKQQPLLLKKPGSADGLQLFLSSTKAFT